MNVKIDGFALLDFGLTDSIIVDGIGLLTFGFVWPCTGDWIVPIDPPANIWVPNTNPIYGDNC